MPMYDLIELLIIKKHLRAYRNIVKIHLLQIIMVILLILIELMQLIHSILKQK